MSLGLPEVVTSARRFDEADGRWIPLFSAASRSLREGGAASKSSFLSVFQIVYYEVHSDR